MKSLKKQIAAIFSVALAVVATTACMSSCVGGGETKVESLGEYTLIDFKRASNPQAELIRLTGETLTLYSDDSYTLVETFETYVTFDGGDNWSLALSHMFVIKGDYQMVSEANEIGDITIQFTSVDSAYRRKDNVDTTVEGGTETEQKLRQSLMESVNYYVGKQVVLSADHSIAEIIVETSKIFTSSKVE